MLKRFFDSVGVSALPFPDMVRLSCLLRLRRKKEKKKKGKTKGTANVYVRRDVYRDRRELSRSLMSQWNVSLSPV